MKSSKSEIKALGFTAVQEKGGVSEFRLDSNGLKVLLAESHVAPVVTTMIVYRVGSRNEGVGFTGSTHFLEHMMFKGTKERNPKDGNGFGVVLRLFDGSGGPVTGPHGGEIVVNQTTAGNQIDPAVAAGGAQI